MEQPVKSGGVCSSLHTLIVSAIGHPIANHSKCETRSIGRPKLRRAGYAATAAVLGAMLLLVLASAQMASAAPTRENNSFGIYLTSSPAQMASAALTPHGTISINGNSQFTPANGVNGGGDGSASKPYIIENWVISALTVEGIAMRDTTKYFVVRNCLVENGGSTYYGIYLYNVKNGRIENNTCRNNYDGIYLESSGNDNLKNNTCKGNTSCGIQLDSSSHDNLTNNTCSNNSLHGICLWSSSNYNNLTNNTCENNDYGIYLNDSDNNTLDNDNCSNNYCNGIELAYYSSYNTLTNNTCSNNSSYLTASGICLSYLCKSNTLAGNICENNDYGIYLVDSSNTNTITLNYLLNNTTNNAYESSCGTNYWDNNRKGNYWSDWQPSPDHPDVNRDRVVDDARPITGGGNQDNYPLVIGLTWTPFHTRISITDNSQFTSANGVTGGDGSADNAYIIENWIISAKNANGIYIQNTTAYFIVRNCLVENGKSSGYYGIYLDNVINGRIENNTYRNNSNGIYLYKSNYNTLTNNTCSNNYYGICLSSSSYDNLTGNTCGNNSNGIYLYYSFYDNLTNDNCSNNGLYGIYLQNSSNNTLTNNNTCSNNEYGIYLRNSSYDNLINNTCGNNGDSGIYLSFSSNNTLDNDNCSSNNYYGIYLYASSYSNLTNNTCWNNFWGIYLNRHLSSYNILIGNTCGNNRAYGIYLYDSSNNTLTGNTCSNNSSTGIYLTFSSNNTLTNNTCSSNSYCGIYLNSSSNNTLAGNTCSNNSRGINLRSSTWHSSSSNNNTITLNHLLYNTWSNAYDEGTNNWDNNGLGNYWSDWQPSNGHPDTTIPPDGIVDTPRQIEGGKNKDNYPLVIIVDVAVTNITPSSSEAYPTWSLKINVTVKNQGTFTETFPVTLYSVLNITESSIGTQTVTLNPQESKILTYTWIIPTIPLAYPYPTYTFKADASLDGDMNPANNVLTAGTVKVKWPGDANGDGHINFIDYAILANSWLQKVGDPNYNPAADFNGDGIVNNYDLDIYNTNYLKGPLD